MKAFAAVLLCAFITAECFQKFNPALENKKSEIIDTSPDRIKFSAAYIKGANGRIQSGAYSDQLQQVIALNIGLIRQDANLTVCNGFDKCSHVEEIIFVDRIVRLDLHSYLEQPSPNYIFRTLPLAPVLNTARVTAIPTWSKDDKFGIFHFRTCLPRSKKLYIRLFRNPGPKISTLQLSYDLSRGDIVIEKNGIIGFLTGIFPKEDHKLLVLEPIFDFTENYRILNKF